ncbi:MAG: hypothetical protein ABW175_04820 [Bradyrhizobium sp.]
MAAGPVSPTTLSDPHACEKISTHGIVETEAEMAPAGDRAEV